MGNSKKLSVELKERSYEIIVGKDLIKTAGQKIEKTISGKDIIIISDKNVAKYYLTELRKSCENAKLSCREIILPPGENAKTFKQLNLLVERLLSMGISRTTTLIALGGGVVGDITGFAASILLRGINFVQVPTTLLAQVDSSVGGKTGINSSQGKNLIGAFYQPKLVIADVSTLDTLPKRQILAGYSEIVKYGLINNFTFFKWLEKKGAEVCSGRKESQIKAIVESCKMKSGFVSKDELENSKRTLLNLGHTFGHAIEAQTGFSNKVLHGEAVSIGLSLAFELSAKLGLCLVSDVKRIQTHFKLIGLPFKLSQLLDKNCEPDNLIKFMKNDKKNKDGKLTLILARGIGKAFVTNEINYSDVKPIISSSLK